MITSAAVLLTLMTVSSILLRQRPALERILIVGTTPMAHKLVVELTAGRSRAHVIAGVVQEGGVAVDPPLDAWLVGPLDLLPEIIDSVLPDRIVIAVADRRGRLPVRELLQACVRGIEVEDAVPFYERLTGKIAIEALTPSHLISSPEFRKGHTDVAFGRAVSLIVALVALTLLAPLLAIIAVAVKVDSAGPILFVQDRAGLRGRRFPLMKFRTMHPVDRATSEWECDNCDRITRLGKWLRRYRLDELPQLVNVLRGEMNLVGPRPHPMSNFELFMRRIPYYWLRSVVRPGLTGWAQVEQGYANGLEEEMEKMRYDLYYIKRMSAWLDLRILCRTVKTVLAGAARRRRTVSAPTGLRVCRLASRIGLVPVLVALLSQSAGATHVSFEPGDVFVSLEEGPVQWYLPDGTLMRVLASTVPGTGEGMGLDPTGNLFVARWCIDPWCGTGNTVERFDVLGRSWGAVGRGFNCSPHTLVFDSAGIAYVGQAGCARTILKFVPGVLDPIELHEATDNQGAFWIDLAADGCTIFYTSYGPNVKRYDGCADVQLADFNLAPMPGGVAQDLRVLPDGGVLVSSGQVIARLDSTGAHVQSYTVPEASYWAGLDLVGDGTFWAVNYESSNLCRFDLNSGTLVASFSAAPSPHSAVGVRVMR